jgi:beta-galactosidase/beta-glucuronidase
VRLAKGAMVASISLEIPGPQLWSPASPFLYNLTVRMAGNAPGHGDVVLSYFGMRTVTLGDTPSGVKSLLLNGKEFFASGWL